MKHLNRLASAAWLLVAGTALVLSNWSLAYVATRWHVQPALAWLVSASFDGVAVIAAALTLKSARLGDANPGGTITVYVFAALSAFFNSLHAGLAGDPWEARVFFAVPPLAALVVLELSLRSSRRDALREAGRIVDPLPAMGGALWVNMPVKTYQGVRQLLHVRRTAALETGAFHITTRAAIERTVSDNRLAIEQAEAMVSPKTLLEGLASKADAVRVAVSAAGNDPSPAAVLAWLTKYQAFLPGNLRGFTLPYVRVCLSRDESRNSEALELSAADMGEILDGEIVPDKNEAAFRTGILPSPVQPGQVFRSGCNHQVEAQRVVRVGDLHPCPICKADTPYLGGMALSEMLANATVKS